MEAQEINFPARLQHIFKEIVRFCQSSMRNAVDVELVFDTEKFSKMEIEKMIDLGIKRFRVNENGLENAKLENVKIHFAGDLENFDWKNFGKINLWENLASLTEAEQVNNFLIRNEIILKVLLRIDFNGVNGFDSKELFLKMKELGKFKNLKIRGISLGKENNSSENFHKMRALFDLLRQKYKGIEILEMGCVKELSEAIAYGAHLITLDKESF